LSISPAKLPDGTSIVLSVRPEQWRIAPGGASGGLTGTVKIVMPLGPQVIYDVEMPGGVAVKISQSRETGEGTYTSGSIIHFAPASPDACRIFPEEQRSGP
jgi:putative spermidine/putrescine transport system ATP-binding protein